MEYLARAKNKKEVINCQNRLLRHCFLSVCKSTLGYKLIIKYVTWNTELVL